MRARAALTFLLCALVLLAARAAEAQDEGGVGGAAAPQAAAREETIDSVQTSAGTLAIVRLGEQSDLRMELRLDGRRVADLEGNMYAGFKVHFREMEGGEVVVMSSTEGGSACPAQFRLIRVLGAGKVSVTDEFGDCSDSPNITLELLPEELISIRFPGYYRLSQREEPGFRRPPPTTWVYKKGVLRELKPAVKRRG
jgi:hypothetical protein